MCSFRVPPSPPPSPCKVFIAHKQKKGRSLSLIIWSGRATGRPSLLFQVGRGVSRSARRQRSPTDGSGMRVMSMNTTVKLLLPPLSEIIRGQQWKPSIYSSGVHVGRGGFKENVPGSTYPGFPLKIPTFHRLRLAWVQPLGWHPPETGLFFWKPQLARNYCISTYSIFSSWLLLLQEFHDIPMARTPAKTIINVKT